MTDDLKVEVVKGHLIVTCPGFRAVYYKAAGQPQLILRERSKTDDYELLAGAFQAAVALSAAGTASEPPLRMFVSVPSGWKWQPPLSSALRGHDRE